MHKMEIWMKAAWIALLAVALVAGCETGNMDNQGTVSLNDLEGITTSTADTNVTTNTASDSTSSDSTNSSDTSTADTSTTNTVANPGFPSEIDTPIKWLHTDVSSWPVTASLSVNFSGSTINFPYSKSREWPAVDGSNGNPWVIAKKDGQWYAATFEWLKFGQTSKPKSTVGGGNIKACPLCGSWAPSSGERVGIMVSGLARSKLRSVKERSNVVMVTWP